MLTVVAAAIAIGEVAFLGVGLASLAVVVLCGIGVWMAKLDENLPGWAPVNRPDAPAPRRSKGEHEWDGQGGRRMSSLAWRLGVAAAGVLIAGVVLARTGEAIAERTGLGSNFVGAALVATSTSLPEVSTVLAAVRLGQYSMAFSDIFGTNLFDIALIFVVDLSYSGQPVLSQVHEFSLLAALLGVAVTHVYMIGLIERRDGALPRIGYDSLAVATLYLSGLTLLYKLR